ncbi:hypothetical protein E2C01_095080 [Portunus trituberculatus]|uniref:Uncharacterized protein n=1 Tax=Portunus trituberculatus TaxID=210409 RepID=A0A5B7JZ23_PORTR|nr:hypothetical protein [Portunus trituberculatus]
MQSLVSSMVVVVAVASVAVHAGPQYKPKPVYGAPVCHPSTVIVTNTETQKVTTKTEEVSVTETETEVKKQYHTVCPKPSYG